MPIITACTMDCGDACSLLVDPEARTVRGNPKHPFTKGFCCKKGGRYFDRLDATERITAPLIKRDGRFVEATWDEALGLAAQRLDAARRNPATILHIRGHGYRGILGKASSILFQALGSSTTRGSLCDETGITASIRDFGRARSQRARGYPERQPHGQLGPRRGPQLDPPAGAHGQGAQAGRRSADHLARRRRRGRSSRT